MVRFRLVEVRGLPVPKGEGPGHPSVVARLASMHSGHPPERCTSKQRELRLPYADAVGANLREEKRRNLKGQESKRAQSTARIRIVAEGIKRTVQEPRRSYGSAFQPPETVPNAVQPKLQSSSYSALKALEFGFSRLVNI